MNIGTRTLNTHKSSPRIATDSDDGDGGASDTNKNVKVAQDNAQETKEGGNRVAASTLNAVTYEYLVINALNPNWSKQKTNSIEASQRCIG